MRGPKLAGERQLLFRDVNGNDFAAGHADGSNQGAQADPPEAKNSHGIVRPRLQFVQNGAATRRERTAEQNRHIHWDSFRQAYHSIFRYQSIFVECGHAAGIDRLPVMHVPASTGIDSVALDPGKNYPISNADLRYVRPYRRNHAAAFVSQQMREIRIMASQSP